MVGWGEKPRKMKHVLISAESHRALKAICARNDAKVQDVVDEIVARWIAEQDQKERRSESPQ